MISSGQKFVKEDWSRLKPTNGGEPKPVLAMVVREQEAEQDKRAGEAADDKMHFHKICVCHH